MQQQTHRGAIHDEVMIVDEEVEVLIVTQQMDAEQPVFVDVIGNHQLGSPLLYIIRIFYLQRECLVVDIYRLDGLTVIRECYPGEQGGVSHHGIHDGCKQPFCIE